MKPSIILLLLVLYLTPLHSQQLVGGGIGRSNYFYIREYTPTVNLNAHCLLRLKGFTLKASSVFMPFTEFGLKYTYYGAIGYSSEFNDPTSLHILFGLLGTDFTKHSYYSNKEKTFFHSERQGSYVINIGGTFAPFQNKKLRVGIDMDVWGETFAHYESRYSYNTYMPISLSASLNYCFGDSFSLLTKLKRTKAFQKYKAKREKKERKRFVLLGVGAGGMLAKTAYKQQINSDLNWFFGRNHLIYNIKAGFQPNTSLGLKYNLAATMGYTSKIQKRLSFYLTLGLCFPYSSKNQFVNDNKETIRATNTSSFIYNVGIQYRIPTLNRLAIGAQLYSLTESFRIGSGKNETVFPNNTLQLTLSYILKGQ